MRKAVALRLNALNAAFYKTQARSFSDTRQAPWPGWARCLEVAGDVTPTVPRASGAVQSQSLVRSQAADRLPGPVRVLDVACGNLRFARFLAGAWPGVRVAYEGVDSCPELACGWQASDGWQVTLRERDVVSELVKGAGECRVEVGGRLGVSLGGGMYDLVVCFGFLHHVPGLEVRERLIRELVGLTRPGGVCCVSLWRLLDDERLARKAEHDTAEGLGCLGLREDDFDPGDRLLGWQGRPGVWRYCHGFDNAEVDALVRAVRDNASLVARFRSDGRSGRLNEYLVLRAR